MRAVLHAAAQPGDHWILALAPAPDALICFLTNGSSRFEHAAASWPAAEAALPAAILDALRDGRPGALRLQLHDTLDHWPWEVELDRACAKLQISRHLIARDPSPVGGAAASGLDSLGSFGRDDPYWAQGAASDWTAQAQAAWASGRALVAVAAQVPGTQANAFRSALATRWRGEPWLSAAAARAAADAGLPRGAWRLYGDARFAPAAASGAEWRQITSVSIDLIQSTGLLQEWGAERYAQNHAAFHLLCRRVVEEHQGRLDDPQGDDGLMAYFGLRAAQEDSAAQAVRAAWALVQEVPQIGFSLRIGIATGRVAVSDGQPFGVVVHLAARLQRVAPADGIVLSDRTHELLGRGVECERLPQLLQLQGFDEPQAAYLVVRVTAPGAVKWPRAGQGHFVGRKQELALLQRAWERTCGERRGQYQCLVGEPGIGKTRLLHEFDQSLRESSNPVTVVMVSGQQELQASAFAALAMALGDPAFHELAAQLASIAPSPDDRRGQEQPPDRKAVVDSLVAGFLRLSDRAALCVIVDDAQWLDPSTIEFVERLQAAGAAAPLLLVVSLREDARGMLQGLDPTEAITLQGLASDESMDLIGALTAATPMAPDVLGFIADRAGGIPLFLEETVRMVRQLHHDPAELAKGIPATLEDLLTARLDALGTAKTMAQLASVLGSEFPVSLWEEVLAEPDEWIGRARVRDAWRRLVDSGVLSVHGADAPRCRFRHALIRDAAYESLWSRDRQRLHGVVARVLQRHPTPAGAELRAHHLTAAGELEEALSAWTLAARAAAAAGADRESLALTRRALALLQELPDSPALRTQAIQLHLLQAARCIALDGYGANSVETAYLRAAALCGGPEAGSMRLRVELGLEACYAMRGELARARELAEQAVRSTPLDGNLRLALQARWAWTNVVFHQGHLGLALDMAEQCLARYQPSLHQPGAVQDPAVMFLCYSGWGMFQHGDAGEARRRVRRALELSQTLDHPFSHAISHGFAASVALFCGDYAEGLKYAEEAMRRCSAKAFQAWLAHAQITRGRLRAALGDTRGGLDDMDQGLALWTATGARITVATYMGFQAEVLLATGEPALALQKLLEAQEIALRHGEHYHEAELLRLRGCAQWQLRGNAADAAAAQALMGEALALARAQGNLGFALRSALALAAAWADEGRGEAASSLVREALQAVPGHQETADARTARALHRLWSGSESEQAQEEVDHAPIHPSGVLAGRS